MSFLTKALKKAHQAHLNANEYSDKENADQRIGSSVLEQTHTQAVSKPIDLQLVFTGVLIILVGVGIYFNYNISSNLESTKSKMAVISDNFRLQEDKFERMNDLIVKMDVGNSGQSKEFLAKIEKLSASVASQIDEVQRLSRSHYLELSKTIEEQEKSIEVLTSKYDRLEKTVRIYDDKNSRYDEQLNALRKKLAEIDSVEVK